MFKKFMLVMGVVLALSLMLAAAALADSTVAAGADAGHALPVTGNAATIDAGASVWYGFQYAGDQSQIQVILNDNGQGGLNFSVYTPDEIANGLGAVGGGSPNADVPADEFWTGNFPQNGMYFVNVTSSNTFSTGYTLQVLGSGVAGLPSAAPAAAAPAAVPAPAPAAAAADGSSWDKSLGIPTGPATIAAGQTLWYKFGYVGDQSQIQVILNDNGQGLTFNIYTPDEIMNGTSAVGSSSPNSDVPADGFWTGNFPQNGMYFVQVTNPTMVPITFNLQVMGSGVQ